MLSQMHIGLEVKYSFLLSHFNENLNFLNVLKYKIS